MIHRNMIGLILALVLGFFIRYIDTDKHGISGDEKISIFMSQFVAMEGANQTDVFFKKDTPYFTPQEFWKEKHTSDFYDAIARADNGSSALYSLSLHYWTHLFGVDDGTVRGFSALWGVLLIAFLYYFVVQHFKSQNLALLVAALAVIEPCLVAWSRTLRTYSMSFFFCLLATHLFLLILNPKNNKVWLFVAYGFVAFACMMCHYVNFTLFALHGLIVLIYSRNLKTWLGLACAMMIPVVGMWWWLSAGGGRYAFKFMEDSARIYSLMATKAPAIGYLALTNPKTVFIQLLPIISNHFLPTNNLFDVLVGKKNFIISILAALISVGVYVSTLKTNLKQIIVGVMFGVSLLLYSTNKFQFLVFSVAIVWGIITCHYFWINRKNQIVTQIYILSIIPLFFFIAFAYQDGNTFRIQQKYIGYSIVFSVILVALTMRFIAKQYPNWVKYSMFLVMAIQTIFIVQTLKSIVQDTNMRYLALINRSPNPHRTTAIKITQNYMASDTILYPSYSGDESSIYAVAPPTYSIIDAQLISLYLPKNANYIQRMNFKEPNKVILKKANGKQVVLFDFQNSIYRY